jgi:hypothetical protein
MIFRPKPVAPPSDPHVRSLLFDGLGPAPDVLALDGTTWGDSTVAVIEDRHLACLAAAFLQAHRVQVSDELGRRIRRAALAEAAGVASIIGCAGRALDALTEAKIEFLAVKGVPVSGLYGPGAPRFMGDVDILVSPADFQNAFDCLARQGGRTYTDSPRFGPAVCPSVNVTDDGGLQIDLHRAIPPWHWARGLTFERLRAGSTPVEVGSRTVSTTNAVHSLLVATASMVSDCGTLYEKILPWRDVVLLVGAVVAEGSTDDLVREAAATGTGWMLRLVLDALPESVRPAAIVDRLATPSLVQRARLAAAHDTRIAGRQWSFIFLRWPLRRVVAFERGMFWPSRASLRAQGYQSRAGFLKDLASELGSN